VAAPGVDAIDQWRQQVDSVSCSDTWVVMWHVPVFA